MAVQEPFTVSLDPNRLSAGATRVPRAPLAEKHDLSETTFLVDGMGYLTALARCELRGHLDYVDRNLIEKWFQTFAMRIDRFHQTWMGSRVSAARWLTAFVYYYNFQRSNQALENRTPVEEVQNR